MTNNELMALAAYLDLTSIAENSRSKRKLFQRCIDDLRGKGLSEAYYADFFFPYIVGMNGGVEALEKAYPYDYGKLMEELEADDDRA